MARIVILFAVAVAVAVAVASFKDLNVSVAAWQVAPPPLSLSVSSSLLSSSLSSVSAPHTAREWRQDTNHGGAGSRCLSDGAQNYLQQQQQQQQQQHFQQQPQRPGVGSVMWLVPPAHAAAALPTPTAAKPPTQDEIKLLRESLAALYGERNPTKAESLLTQALAAWERQPPDERAALRRVRGDCYLRLADAARAFRDYTVAIELLDGPGGDKADPGEVPSARLGRARAIRSLLASNALDYDTLPLSLPTSTSTSTSSSTSTSTSTSPSSYSKEELYSMAARDYGTALRLSSRDDYDDDYDTDDARQESGARRNPYAAWEWGMALRASGDCVHANVAHNLASEAFADIGDKARSVISALDAAIDLAASAAAGTSNIKGGGGGGGGSGGSDDNATPVQEAALASATTKEAIKSLTEAIARTTSVDGTDVALLQRVIAKEGEARIALATLLWSTPNSRLDAEAQLGEACMRLDQLDVNAAERESLSNSINGFGGGGGNNNNNNNNNNNSRKKEKVGFVSQAPAAKLGYSIDDIPGAGQMSCSKFKKSTSNEKAKVASATTLSSSSSFVADTLLWPEPLRKNLESLETLGKTKVIR